MILNRIKASELSDIKKKHADNAGTAEGGSEVMVLDVDSRKILRGLNEEIYQMNEDFDELINELETSLIRAN